MKKAKIVLSAVALFAVVGGAFAFKATKFGAGALYYPGTSTFTTAVNGPVYYSLTAAGKSYNTTAAGGISTLFYQSTSMVAAGKTALILPTTTRATFVGE